MHMYYINKPIEIAYVCKGVLLNAQVFWSGEERGVHLKSYHKYSIHDLNFGFIFHCEVKAKSLE